MKDRVPGSPGRVLITPEGGGAAFYATMARADNPIQEGDPLNKATLLTDETAALFGLGANSLPTDVLAAIKLMLDSKAVTTTLTATIPAAWSADTTNGGYYQIVAVPGILASDNPIVDLVLGTDVAANTNQKRSWSYVDRIVTAEGSVTVYANNRMPEVALNVQMKVVR